MLGLRSIHFQVLAQTPQLDGPEGYLLESDPVSEAELSQGARVLWMQA